MKAATKNNRRFLPLVALVLAGLIYMLICISQMQKSANAVESYSLLATRYNYGELIRNSVDDSASPAYLIMLKTWLHFFGYSDATARVFSMLIGAVALIEIYLIFKYRFSKKAAVWALALFATSPMFVWAGCEAGCIVFYLALFFLFVYLALIAKHSGRKWWPCILVGAAAVSILALIIILSERQGVYFAVVFRFICLYLVFRLLSSGKRQQNTTGRTALICLAVLNLVTLPNINAIRGLGGKDFYGRELYNDIIGLGADEYGAILCGDVAVYKEIAPYIDAVYMGNVREAKIYKNGKIDQIPDDQKQIWVLSNDKEYSLEGWERLAFSNLEYERDTFYLELYQRE